MIRFFSALALCICLLVLLSVFLFPPVRAADDPILKLLNLPAPPPGNPDVHGLLAARDETFYDTARVPKDDAPIEDLLDYWERKNSDFKDLGFNIEPSAAVRARIVAEIAKNPKLLGSYLNILKGDAQAAQVVKEIYDRGNTDEGIEKTERRSVKEWLLYNSPYFSDELYNVAATVADTDEYTTGQAELLALTSVDFNRARPIIERLNGDASLKASRVLAKWALYKHALETSSSGDIERYRDELKKVVEDKSASPGMRDLAMDALSHQKEWPGRDEWYLSLFSDETLFELKVNGEVFTGLTTMMLVSPDEKFVDKMIELTRSPNKAVRSAAVRNLVTRLTPTNNLEILRALLPLLDDPKWVNDSGGRVMLIQRLGDVELPESVPGLISILSSMPLPERSTQNGNSANTAASAATATAENAANTFARAANAVAIQAAQAASNSTWSDPGSGFLPSPVPNQTYEAPINRISVISALAKQKDPRAVPVLRTFLPKSEGYEAGLIVKAIWQCGGYSISELMDGLETALRNPAASPEAIDTVSVLPQVPSINSNSKQYVGNYVRHLSNDPKYLLGEQIIQSAEIGDDLARAIVDRIETLDEKGDKTAYSYRRTILKWRNAVINMLLLRDLKRGMADADSIVRLLAQRRELREKQSTDIFDAKTGKGTAFGIASCLLEDSADYASILEKGDAESKTAFLACARLIRTPLPVAAVAENLKSPNGTLKLAAERYLESEDSAEARGILLGLHPNEARILGSTSAFFAENHREFDSVYLYSLFQSIGNETLYLGWMGSGNDEDLAATEKRLQAEVKKDDDLAAIYSYDKNYIRLYKDKAVFSWDEDESRYRERPLTKFEYNEFVALIDSNRADEQKPFLACGGEYCTAKEFLMLNRKGGRRVYMNGLPAGYGGGRSHDFFTGLDKYFTGLKRSPATLKYMLSREIPGLEIIYASEDFHVETVWKDGSDFRVAASSAAVRKKIDEEIENLDGDTVTPDEEVEAKAAEIREKHRYDGFSWFKLSAEGLGSEVPQPPNIELIPVNDGVGIKADAERWKARTGSTEIRASDDGLFKILPNGPIKLRSGKYQNPVISSDGRWLLASKTDENYGTRIVRVDLLNNKEISLKLEGYAERVPAAYLTSMGKFLIAETSYSRDPDGEADDGVAVDADPDSMILVDPATAATAPAKGEFRPAAQQTFRTLQKTSRPDEFWAAMPSEEKNETDFGIYNAKTMTFKPLLKVPKIKFNSMTMWVDEPIAKIYFVYRGHLLALPLPKS